MLVVNTPAASTALTLLATVKADLVIGDTSADTLLERLIAANTSMVCRYLNVATATDGTFNLGRETLVETFRPDHHRYGRSRHAHRHHNIQLARWPAVSITSIVLDGTTIDPSTYVLDGAAGLLQQVDGNGFPLAWIYTTLVVTYLAGWLLPEDSDRNLPEEIEEAVISLVKDAYFMRRQNSKIKSEAVTGIRTVDYWVGAVGDNGAIPPDIAAKLDPYRNVSIG